MRSIEKITVLENIPVLVRTALNAEVENGVVTNDFRLRSALQTITYLQKRHARVILASHISGTGTETLRPMFEAMQKWIPNLSFSPVSTGSGVRAMVRNLEPGHVLMLENLRRNKGEEQNDPTFAEELADLADIFVQDSFDVCHRSHASVVGVPKLLPSYAGFLIEKEVQELSKALSPKRPSLAIIGGAKFSTKQPVLKRLLKTYDKVFVGGALANDFMKARGNPVGVSLVSGADASELDAVMKSKRLLLPIDYVVAKAGARQGRVAEVKDVREDEAILDNGPRTIQMLALHAARSKTVLWNGPLGNYENGFAQGTEALAKVIASTKTRSIVGGGDTVVAIEGLHLEDQFTFISTGGGAMLDFLAKGTLPGLDALR